ncbi:hypothetical protein [Hymenobacter sp.]|uniref:hypothetical protein n=1 Tax=Hymenobacter sp. TaxID=1898978 RepID=UPI002EDA60C7
MQLSFNSYDSILTGQYYYLRNGRLLRLAGRVSADGELKLRESTDLDTAATGWFVGRVQPGRTLAGTWHNAAGTVHLPFQLIRLVGTAPPAADRARVSSKIYFKVFTLPVATVPDAAVTKLLAQWFSLESIVGEPVSELRERLNDPELMHSGVQAMDYGKLYNDHGLLNISTTVEGIGASVWYDIRSRTIDLNSGFPVVLADEIRPELVPEFLKLGQQKLQKITQKYVPTQEGFLAPEDVAGVLSQEFSLGSTDEYTVSVAGLTCDHPVNYDGLSNLVWKVLTGNFQVEFTHAELARFLKLDSPLRRLGRR